MSDQDVLSGGGEGTAAAPADFPPRGPEDLLGLRIAAALIDLAVLAGLLVILSAAVGQAEVGGGSFNIFLSWAWTGVFLAMALGYAHARSQCALAAVDNEVLGALDDSGALHPAPAGGQR